MRSIKYLTKNNLEKINEVLKNGGVIIIPTDTVYGIACDCFNTKAIEKIFEWKKRDNQKPIGVLTDSYEKIEKVARITNDKEKDLIHKFLPGELTIILEKKEIVPDILTANQKTIGVRIPNDKKTLKILKNYQNPLATTSLNISGEEPMSVIDEKMKDFVDKIDLLIIGSNKKSGIPSTVVRVEKEKIVVLRQEKIKVD